MCGICGIYAYHYAAPSVETAELSGIRDHMTARGPDGMGSWLSADRTVGLAHRRLSIIDLSDAGTQPMESPDGRLVVTFNGEIYNHRELRRELEATGRRFKSQSDTEVLLHLYDLRGPRMVDELRGMYAFAIWDRRERQLFLARDPYGIKPLYYADDGWTFRFASQVKALRTSSRISGEADAAGWVGYLLLGSVPEPFTTFRDIRALEAGHTLLVDASGQQRRCFRRLGDIYRQAERLPPADGDVQEVVREALLDSVRHHLVSDVPVGAFLSAGVDSGALLGLMRDAGQRDIQTVTIAFEEFRGTHQDEAPIAENIARQYGARHTTRVVTRSEFTADLPRILAEMDQPSIDGINTWFVSKAAHELGLKVAVSGLGGDELFGGYPSFSVIPRWRRVLAAPSRVPFAGRGLRRLAAAALARSTLSPKFASVLEFGGSYEGAYLLQRGLFMPWELPSIMPTDFAHAGLSRLAPLRHLSAELSLGPQTPFAKVATLESAFYMRNQLLRDADWASMAHSLEVRVPLVDIELLSRLAPLTCRGRLQHGKAALAASPSPPLPRHLVERRKTGFGTPIGAWLQAGLRASSAKGAARLPSSAHWSRRWAVEVAAPALG